VLETGLDKLVQNMQNMQQEVGQTQQH